MRLRFKQTGLLISLFAGLLLSFSIQPTTVSAATVSQEWTNCYALVGGYPSAGYAAVSLNSGSQAQALAQCFGVSGSNGFSANASGSSPKTYNSPYKTPDGQPVCVLYQKENATDNFFLNCTNPTDYISKLHDPLYDIACPTSVYKLDYYGTVIDKAGYAACKANVDKAYDACDTPVAAGVSTQKAASEVAACMKTTYGISGSATDLATAIDSGRATAAGTAQSNTNTAGDAQASSDQASCEKAKKTWNAASKTCEDGATTDSAPVCIGGNLGWVLCPLTTVFQDITDLATDLLDALLFISPIGSNTDLQNAWGTFVGFANLLLIVAFLVVIFSQATSFGLDSYGIKKMLPRIIAAAILINLSYLICTIALDVTNVVGKSMGPLIQNVTPSANSLPASVGVQAGTSSPAAWTKVLVGAVITGAIAAAAGAIAFIVPLLLGVVVAVLGTLFIIVFRQVAIILLIVISPLAFAAMILPNTEPLFQKWRKYFTTLLLMYPVVMLFMYIGKFVAFMILSGQNTTNTGFSAFVMQLVAVLALSGSGLIGSYTYLKNSDKLAAAISTGVGKVNKGVVGRTNAWASEKRKNSTAGIIAQSKKNARTASGQATAYNRMGRGLGRAVAGFGLGRGARQIQQTQITDVNDKLHAQRVGVERQAVSQRFNASDASHRAQMAAEARSAAQSGDQVKLDALMSHAASAGADEFADVYEQVQSGINLHGKEGASLADSNRFISATHGAELSQKSRGIANMLQTSTKDNIHTAEKTIEGATRHDAGTQTYYGKMSAEKVAGFSSNTAKEAAQFIDDQTLHRLLYDPEVAKSVSPSARRYYEAEVAERAAGATRSTPGGVSGGTGHQSRSYI